MAIHAWTAAPCSQRLVHQGPAAVAQQQHFLAARFTQAVGILAGAQAYGWSDYSADMPDEEILKRLLALNLQRSATIE